MLHLHPLSFTVTTIMPTDGEGGLGEYNKDKTRNPWGHPNKDVIPTNNRLRVKGKAQNSEMSSVLFIQLQK